MRALLVMIDLFRHVVQTLVMIMLQTQHSFHIHSLHDVSSQLCSPAQPVHARSILHARHAHLGRTLARLRVVSFIYSRLYQPMRANRRISSSNHSHSSSSVTIGSSAASAVSVATAAVPIESQSQLEYLQPESAPHLRSR
jgi:hypothetical protein